MSIDWNRFVEMVSHGRRFLLTTHIRPDCDALGSELGMARVLESLGKHVSIINADGVPPHLAFIDADRRIQPLSLQAHAETIASCDVLMVLDTASWAQLGAMADVLRGSQARKIVVDHHVSQDDLGAELFKDMHAESTGRLVLEAAEALQVTLTAEMAQPLFTALATDTGWFRFSSVSGATFRAAGRLVDAGARPTSVYAELYEQNTLARVRLRGRILEQARSEIGGRLMIARVTQEDLRATGAQPSDTEDVVNLLLGVAGSEVAVLFQQLRDGTVKASLRSVSKIDVRQVAEQFGGGGHMAAAGVTLEGPMSRAEQVLLDALRRTME
jgi:phosphoesterase RecJ-like protein